VVARVHKTLIWERTRHTQRLRHALREYFPAALEAFEDLAASDTLELLSKGPDPAAAVRLSISQISAALRRAGRRKIEEKAAVIQTALRAEHLRQPEVVVAAYVASVQSTVAVLKVLVEQVKTLQGRWRAILGGTRSLRSSCPAGAGSDPGRSGAGRVRRRRRPLRLGQVPQELRGHQPDHPRLGQEEARAGPVRAQRPAHRCPGRPSVRHAERLTGCPGLLRPDPARGVGHRAALRQLANRLVGILHGCLKTGTVYDETTAWPADATDSPAAA
jgi:hypothetical protein